MSLVLVGGKADIEQLVHPGGSIPILSASMNTIRIRLGHESLDIALAYLKGKDAESEEAQELANSSSLALYA